MRSPLTETYYKVQGMITYVRENLSTDEYMLYLDLLVPEPEPIVKVAKKARKKRAAKSAHQQSLSSAIQRAGKGRVENDDDDDDGFCAACHVQIGHNVHHLESLPDYHPFQSKSDAHSAGGRSSANGAGSSTTANFEVEKESVSTATGG